ncbi:MAG: hypothetical protein JWO05_2863 [Gemmatimonadetes bacterium]|nr:hypothetical protein [Gemmatimonadota bacterium]
MTSPHGTLFRRSLAAAADAAVGVLRRTLLRGDEWSAGAIPIRVAWVRGDHEPYAQRVANALAVIARHDPHRMTRLRRDVSAILVWPGLPPGVVGQFWTRDAVCALDAASVKAAPTYVVATWLVHEATHARLSRVRLTDQNVARIERICCKQELAFAERIPGGGAFASTLRENVAASAVADHTRDGQVERAFAALAKDGMSPHALSVLRAVIGFLKRW